MASFELRTLICKVTHSLICKVTHLPRVLDDFPFFSPVTLMMVLLHELRGSMRSLPWDQHHLNSPLSGYPKRANSLLLLGFVSLIDLVHAKADQKSNGENEGGCHVSS